MLEDTDGLLRSPLRRGGGGEKQPISVEKGSKATQQCPLNPLACRFHFLLTCALLMTSSHSEGLVVYKDELTPPSLGENVAGSSDGSGSGCFEVESFLVSCRSLHLGVEHAMMQQLAVLAKERRAEEIRIRWKPTERNDAACHFFTGIPGATFVETAGEQARGSDSGCAAAAAAAATTVAGGAGAGGGGGGIDNADATAAAAAGKGGLSDYKAAMKDRYGASNAENNQKFMTPDLALLSKKKQKKELKRRILEAKRKDDAWVAEKAKESTAKRAAERNEDGAKPPLAPNASAASQHRPFGDKPAPGWVHVPVASAEALHVSVTNPSTKKTHGNGVGSAGAGVSGAAAEGNNAARLVRATVGGAQRLIALHHETTLSVALALSAQQSNLAAFMAEAAATSNAAVVEQLLQPDEGGVGRNHNGRGAGADGTELAAFQEGYTLREQARDYVKVLIQNRNPGSYAHVEHTPKKIHRERVLAESKARKEAAVAAGGAPADCG